jgi:hypothetical protein
MESLGTYQPNMWARPAVDLKSTSLNVTAKLTAT